jgi:hypothetical protein
MTDQQLTEATPAELQAIMQQAKELRLKAAKANKFILHAEHGHTILKCQQLLEHKCR